MIEPRGEPRQKVVYGRDVLNMNRVDISTHARGKWQGRARVSSGEILDRLADSELLQHGHPRLDLESGRRPIQYFRDPLDENLVYGVGSEPLAGRKKGQRHVLRTVIRAGSNRPTGQSFAL